MTPFWGFGPFGGYVTETHISPSDRNICSKKKYVAISPRSGAYAGERNLLLSAIRRSWLFWAELILGRSCESFRYSIVRLRVLVKKHKSE